MDLIHMRIVCPADLTEQVHLRLSRDPSVVNLVVLPSAVRNPDGDLIECDVLPGATNKVMREVRVLGVDLRGSITVDGVDLALSGRAERTQSRQLPVAVHTPLWELVESRIRADATYPPSFYLYLIIAGVIGAVGILSNSQILIVAAMVVGPEYGAIVAVALGIDTKHIRSVRRGMTALGVGFLLAIAAAFLFALTVRGAGLTPNAYELGIRPVSQLIDTPNLFSFVVAALAGVVGVVALAEARSSTLLGVFISVTTIPAASDCGVSMAFGSRTDAWGSLVQLLLNVVVLIVVGFLTLRVQRVLWRRVDRRNTRRIAGGSG
ncbi:DUF389 domain-containing protein [Phytomonospora sp. NPDC050363]|uniref:DUF389 domain-containing protein n=1 Tax=Phytomonospora sp. NPDC050363 TaxID=3155642 RepID=UPI0033C6FBBC